MTQMLVLPPRFTPDSIRLWRSATLQGWQVERLEGWRVPPWLRDQPIAFYGEPLFAAVVADQLGVLLVEPTLDWLARLPVGYRKRDVVFTTLRDARTGPFPRFIKPADDKCFPARVYAQAEDLVAAVAEDTPVLTSEPVCFEVEFRMFVLNREVVTHSAYARFGKVNPEDAEEWPASPEEVDGARAFADVVLRDPMVEIPPATVLDIGFLSGSGWAVVETNAAWGSGLYGCDERAVLSVLQRATVTEKNATEEDRQWVLCRQAEKDGA